MTSTLDIESLCRWSKPKEVATKKGPRILRTAKPTEAFSAAYNADKEAMRQQGLTFAPDRVTGEWCCQWWQHLPQSVTDQRATLLEMSRAADADIEIPAPEGCTPMPFQKAGVQFALNIFNQGTGRGVLIADEMGLGKTIQALLVTNCLPDVHRVLILTKASLKINWQRECEKWLVRKMSVGIATAQSFPATDVVIMNFDIAHKFPTKLSYYWDLVIIDEVQSIKNRKSRRARAIIGYRPTKKEQAKGAVSCSGIPRKRALALTGTPIENRPEELWTILNFLDPQTYGSFWNYATKFCAARNNGFGFDTSGASNLDLLQKTLRSTLMIRRLKRDVLTDLPPKTRMIVELDPDRCNLAIAREQKTWTRHEEQLERLQAELEIAKCEDGDAYTAAVKRLRQSSQVAFTEIAKVRHQTAVAKIPQLIEALAEDLETATKIIFFAHHRDVLESVFAAYRGKAVMVHGETPIDDRDKAVQRFQKNPACRLFCGSIRATGEGLTLTAATLVVFGELDWVPGKVSQCEDRAHRIGQKDNVFVKHLVVPGSIDARVVRTILDKQILIDQALDTDQAELASAPVLVPKAPECGTRKQIEREAELITLAQRAAVLQGLRQLSRLCDGAHQKDGAGFNRIDSRIGKDLAQQSELSTKQGILGRNIARRYKAQIGEALIEAMGR